MTRSARVIALAVAGLGAGVIAGSLGVGGGIVLTPALIVWGRLTDREAAAASLMAIIPAAGAGAAAYSAAGEFDALLALVLAAGGVAGLLVSSWLARRVRTTALRWVFVGVLLLVAVRMLLPLPAGETAHGPVPLVVAVVVAAGIVMGLASGMFGIGGGFVAVPTLVLVVGLSDLASKGTALAAMVPIAVLGTALAARSGVLKVRLSFGVGAAASVGAVAGVYVAFVVSRELLVATFVALVVATAARLAVRAARGEASAGESRAGGPAPASD